LRPKKKRVTARPEAALRRKSPRLAHPKSHVSTLWTEALFGAEILILHANPVYYGFGIPKGDGSAVVVIPGFLGTDLYLTELHSWLQRIGYRPYFSGIGINAECPNLLIQRRLNQTIDKAREDTGRKIHLIEPCWVWPKRFACASWKSMAAACCPTATPGVAPATFWIFCAGEFPAR
jgi:hypothetical protein